MVYSNFFPKYSVTRKELVKHKNSQYRFYSRESLPSIDDWKKEFMSKTYSRKTRSTLRINNFGWREPQNAESPSVGS